MQDAKVFSSSCCCCYCLLAYNLNFYICFIAAVVVAAVSVLFSYFIRFSSASTHCSNTRCRLTTHLSLCRWLLIFYIPEGNKTQSMIWYSNRKDREKVISIKNCTKKISFTLDRFLCFSWYSFVFSLSFNLAIFDS